MSARVAEATALREAVDARREPMLAQLRELVEIESGTDDAEGVDRVGALLAELLDDSGLAVQRAASSRDFGHHLVAEAEASAPGPRVLLMGHMDTVYPRGTGWGFRLDGERAYGPGVADMKSGLLVAVHAVRVAAEALGTVPNVRVAFNSDEEPGSPESRDLLPAWADGARYALVFEPSEPSGLLVHRRKGVGIFRLEITGRAAHAGQEPERGRSAISELVAQIAAIEALARPEEGTTVNAGTVAGGTAPYVVPADARAEVDVRVTSAAERRRVEAAVVAAAARRTVDGVEVAVSGGFHRPPMERLPGAAVVEAALARGAEALGIQAPGFGLSGAASDGNNLSAEGVPVIDGLGPVGGALHSPDEWMVIETFFARTAMVASALCSLARDEEAIA
jgi:glutamate carboxypeptidase